MKTTMKTFASTKQLRMAPPLRRHQTGWEIAWGVALNHKGHQCSFHCWVWAIPWSI